MGAEPMAGWRLLGVVAHPDDEAWALGGALASCALFGGEVHLLCATRGEGGADRRGLVPRGPAIAALRTAELEASCAALGVRPPRILDLPDGGLASLAGSRGADAVADAIARVRPQVVLTMGPDGGYGHPDHLAVTRWCRAAVVAAEPTPRLLEALFPRALFEPMRDALRRLPGVVAPELRTGPLGVQRDEVDLVLDVRPVRELKRASVAAHASQLAGGDPGTLLHRRAVDALWDEEWVAATAGPPLPAGADSPFDGLDR